MYHHNFDYVSKRNSQVKNAYSNALGLLHEAQKIIKEEHGMTFAYYVVGSYKRNMLTHDPKTNVGFDFDFNIVFNNKRGYSPAKLKNSLREALNKIARKYQFDFPEDSTRVLTLKVKDRKQSKIVYSIDLAIVNEDFTKYIHFNKSYLQNEYAYRWQQMPQGYEEFSHKFDALKKSGHSDKLREEYLRRKNTNMDSNVHSRDILIQTVNDLYNSKVLNQSSGDLLLGRSNLYILR